MKMQKAVDFIHGLLLRKKISILKKSSLFDAEWYLEKYPDIAAARVDAARHYLIWGAAEGRDPSQFFNTSFYCDKNKDIDFSSVNPLLHHLEKSSADEQKMAEEIIYESKQIKANQMEKKMIKKMIKDLTEFSVEIKGNCHKLMKKLEGLRPDLSSGMIRNSLINDAIYYQLNPDVRTAKMDPLLHYIKYGFMENKRKTGIILNKNPVQKKHKNVGSLEENKEENMHAYVFIGPSSNGSFKYRCAFPAMKSGAILITEEWPLENILIALFSCKDVTFLRPSLNERTIYLLTICKNIGLRICVDYDDVLMPDLYHQKGSTRSRVEKKLFSNEIAIHHAHSSLAMWADNFTCSTPAIANFIEQFHKPVDVIPNKLPFSFFKNDIFVRNGSDRLKLLYPSGTKTHFRDFSLISGVIIRLLQEFPDKFEIMTLGKSANLFACQKFFGDNVKFHEEVPFEEMLNIYALHDAILVPLEKTAFNNAKSCIKYIEAASQGVPIIATPVSEFKSRINHGVDGFLCETDLDWYSLLKQLIEDRSILHSVGIHAYQKAKKENCINV